MPDEYTLTPGESPMHVRYIDVSGRCPWCSRSGRHRHMLSPTTLDLLEEEVSEDVPPIEGAR